MISIIESVISELNIGNDVVMCSIIASSGSTPRGAGAKMAVFQNGSIKGTIGGGKVEFNCIQQAHQALIEKKSFIDSYVLNRNEINDIGMICGGSVVVYFQYLDHTNDIQTKILNEIYTLLLNHRDLWLINMISNDTVSQFGIYTPEEGIKYLGKSHESEIMRMITNNIQLNQDYFPAIYVEPISSSRLYLFGAGHVGKALAPVLQRIDFNVIVYDNRPGIVDLENTPGASEIIFGDYNNIFDKITITDKDYAVVMTPGHQSDYEILNQLLRTDATYIGCIGSKRKVEITKELLLKKGHTQENISRIHSPIGLKISAKTPEEIAISIAAELIQHRAGLSPDK